MRGWHKGWNPDVFYFISLIMPLNISLFLGNLFFCFSVMLGTVRLGLSGEDECELTNTRDGQPVRVCRRLTPANSGSVRQPCPNCVKNYGSRRYIWQSKAQMGVIDQKACTSQGGILYCMVRYQCDKCRSNYTAAERYLASEDGYSYWDQKTCVGFSLTTPPTRRDNASLLFCDRYFFTRTSGERLFLVYQLPCKHTSTVIQMSISFASYLPVLWSKCLLILQVIVRRFVSVDVQWILLCEKRKKASQTFVLCLQLMYLLLLLLLLLLLFLLLLLLLLFFWYFCICCLLLLLFFFR